MSKLPEDHFLYVVAAFVAVLGAFTALAMIGSDGQSTLRDVLLATAGAVFGIAVPKKP